MGEEPSVLEEGGARVGGAGGSRSEGRERITRGGERGPP